MVVFRIIYYFMGLLRTYARIGSKADPEVPKLLENQG